LIRKKWLITEYDKDLAAQIAQKHNLNPFAALLATSRGLISDGDIADFFSDDNLNLSDPFVLPDMKSAVTRLEKAIEKCEPILIFGDFDADGVTATALLYSYLDTRGANVQAYIPNRLTEGYGLSVDAVHAIKNKGVKLIVTVDNGISALEEAELIVSLGMELIITDHHKPKDVLPSAVAVIDPHRLDCACNFVDFAGVGVAFKLVCALHGGDPFDLLEEFGDILAIGTVGDIVPIIGENRFLVKKGIEVINGFSRPGIRALLEIASAGEKTINSSGVSYILCPRINAAGRMGSAERALACLLSDDEEVAEELAIEINDENIQRKEIEADIRQKVEQILIDYPEREFDEIIVVDGDAWHNGVIGIVASRLVSKYGRPCIVIAKDGGSARGSGRSIKGFSLYNALDSVSSLLTHFGGHPLAAGLEMPVENIPAFRKALNEYAKQIEMPFPIERIDFKLNLKSVEMALVNAVSVLEPYGARNPQPVFGLFGMSIETVQPVSEGKHTRLQISKGQNKISAIIFNCVTDVFPYEKGDVVDLSVLLEKNEYRNTISVSTRVQNIRIAGLDEDKLLFGFRLYENFRRGESLPNSSYKDMFPDRELFASIYRKIKEMKSGVIDIEKLCYQIQDDGGRIAAITIAVEVMLDEGLLKKKDNGKLVLNVVDHKVNLENSNILKRLKELFISA
jgi:single-stranded-DNA-specific exonuclease